MADTYLLLQDKENSPRIFFMYWRDNLSKQLAHRLQYNAIAEAIKKKKNGQKYSNIDLHVLLDSFINNGQDKVALEEEEDDKEEDKDNANGSNNINNDDNNNGGQILELEGKVLSLPPSRIPLSVEPWYYSTYRELQLRIFTIPTLKSREVVGNLLAACSLVRCLFGSPGLG